MTAYRGKHSRSNSDTYPDSEQQISDIQPQKRTGYSRLQPEKAVREKAQTQTRKRHTSPSEVLDSEGAQSGGTTIRSQLLRKKKRISGRGGVPGNSQSASASPHAFKHHDAVTETGGRPRHSKLKTILIVIPLVVVLIAAAVGGFFLFNSSLAAEEIEAGVPVTVTIPDGASSNQIANILKEAQVISDTSAFIAEVRSMNAEQSLQPGTYELETLMDTTVLINTLLAGPLLDGNRLTIPEGLTVEQTAAVVEESCGITESDFLARAYAADEYVSDYPFLEGVYNNSLEGFLYPKTYNIPSDADADYVVRVLLDQFALEISDLDLTYAEEHGMNLFNIITIASLIEEETAAEEERALVSSVIYNRLREGMQLQIDATVVYALGASYDGHDLLYEDLEVDSPYNTYLVYELPAGPICSPSIKSILAAAAPAETNYYYYVLTSTDGHHTFCETSEEFEAAKEEYERLFGIE